MLKAQGHDEHKQFSDFNFKLSGQGGSGCTQPLRAIHCLVRAMRASRMLMQPPALALGIMISGPLHPIFAQRLGHGDEPGCGWVRRFRPRKSR